MLQRKRISYAYYWQNYEIMDIKLIFEFKKKPDRGFFAILFVNLP